MALLFVGRRSLSVNAHDTYTWASTSYETNNNNGPHSNGQISALVLKPTAAAAADETIILHRMPHTKIEVSPVYRTNDSFYSIIIWAMNMCLCVTDTLSAHIRRIWCRAQQSSVNVLCHCAWALVVFAHHSLSESQQPHTHTLNRADVDVCRTEITCHWATIVSSYQNWALFFHCPSTF